VNNYLATGMPNNVNYQSWNNRIDFQATGKNRFFFRWLKSHFEEDAQGFTYESQPGLMDWDEIRPAISGALDWTYAANATTVLNASVDTTQFKNHNQRLGTRAFKPTDVGLPAYLDQKCADDCLLPRVVWPGMPYWGGDMILSVPLDPGHHGRQQSVKFNFSQVRGSHSLRAGVDLRQHLPDDGGERRLHLRQLCLREQLRAEGRRRVHPGGNARPHVGDVRARRADGNGYRHQRQLRANESLLCVVRAGHLARHPEAHADARAAGRV
jgi:hypothetical protein